MMQGSVEYVVAGRAVATYDALTAAVRERLLVVVHADVRHLTLAFRPAGGEWGEGVTILCAVVDTGHGLSKLVLIGLSREGGSTVSLADYPLSLFADVERRLRSEAGARRVGALVRP
jgi:hypothetical protein